MTMAVTLAQMNFHPHHDGQHESDSALRRPQQKNKNEDKKKVTAMPTQMELLALFFAQYQHDQERTNTSPYNDADNDDENDEAAARRREKGKDKLTPEEEEELLEEQESGEEGISHSSADEEEEEGLCSFFEDDEDFQASYEAECEYYLHHFDVSDLVDDVDATSSRDSCSAEEDKEIVETEEERSRSEEADRWERRTVGYKCHRWVSGGLRRHSRDLKRPRRRPERWVNARAERMRCDRDVRKAVQFAAQQTNATRGLQYRSIDYWSIRQNLVAAPPPASTNATYVRHHEPPRSSNNNNNRVPVYEREVTSAIDRGRHVDCGLTVQQLNDLLNRELTPEDYELLLMLDSTVKPKTVSVSLIDSFPSRTVEAGSPLLDQAERCAICMSGFEVGEGIKELPRCGHCFHGECITQWLSTASTKCPLCGCTLDD